MASVHREQVSDQRDGVLDGLEQAGDGLFDQVYSELRRRARGQRRRWNGDPSLRTTALVNEVYLKLVGGAEQSWESRSHFFAVAAKAMRQILINEARAKRAEKRGGAGPILSLEALREALGRAVATAEQRAEGLLVLEQALEDFECQHPRAARVVECRFYGGMTIEQTAEALGISASTVTRDWKLAQAWLYRRMEEIWAGDRSAEDDEA